MVRSSLECRLPWLAGKWGRGVRLLVMGGVCVLLVLLVLGHLSHGPTSATTRPEVLVGKEEAEGAPALAKATQGPDCPSANDSRTPDILHPSIHTRGIPASCMLDGTCAEIMSTHLAAQAPHQEGGEFEDKCAYRTERGRTVAALSPPPEERRIPKIVHFIFGLSTVAQAGNPFDSFSLVNYLVVKAALKTIQPTEIMFHYGRMPEGKYWERVKRLPKVTLHQVVPVTEVFGNPVNDIAHKADVLRLQVLREHGGIYLDIDSINIKSLDPLLHHEGVMAMQGQNYGLCNAFMMFSKNSSFLQHMWESYRTFNGSLWDHHSVVLPLQLAQDPATNEGLCMLHRLAYFYPSYYSNHQEFVHRHDVYPFINSYQYGYHMNEHGAFQFGVDKLTVSEIQARNTSITRLLALYLDGDEKDDEQHE